MLRAAHRPILALAGLTGVMTAALLQACVGTAAAADPCVPSSDGTSTTCTYQDIPDDQVVTVLAGVTSVTVSAAQGAATQPSGQATASSTPPEGSSTSAVLPGVAPQTLPVTPGSTLVIHFGNADQSSVNNGPPALPDALAGDGTAGDGTAGDTSSAAASGTAAPTTAAEPTDTRPAALDTVLSDASASWVVPVGSGREALIRQVPAPPGPASDSASAPATPTPADVSSPDEPAADPSEQAAGATISGQPGLVPATAADDPAEQSADASPGRDAIVLIFAAPTVVSTPTSAPPSSTAVPSTAAAPSTSAVPSPSASGSGSPTPAAVPPAPSSVVPPSAASSSAAPSAEPAPSVEPTPSRSPVGISSIAGTGDGGGIITGYGFAPGEVVTGTLQPTSLGAGSALADPSGVVRVALVLPVHVDAEDRGVVLKGLSSGRLATASLTTDIAGPSQSVGLASDDLHVLVAGEGAALVVGLGVVASAVRARRRS